MRNGKKERKKEREKESVKGLINWKEVFQSYVQVNGGLCTESVQKLEKKT